MNNTPNHPDLTPPNADFWKGKLAALLHDTPSKCLDIPGHWDKSISAMRRAGFDDNWIGKYDHAADHTAAAADRLPFPNSRASGLTCAFDGHKNAFRHPLGGNHTLPFTPIQSSQLGETWEQEAQPPINHFSDTWLESDIWRARFFAHWRLWRERAVDKDFRMGFLPADTRIPDHTIWNHTAIVSALAGCRGKPAFLKFQMGPVQDFIAAARNTRDLWSGSYLLSWLMAAGLKKLSELCGPDAIMFPSLRNQPLFDLHWRDELWSQIHADECRQPFWEKMAHDTVSLLTPNLPNVFLALVPAEDADKIALSVESAIRNEWNRIADDVWNVCSTNGLLLYSPIQDSQEKEQRYREQVFRHLQLSWQVFPWPSDIKSAEQQAKSLPDPEALKRLRTVLKAFQEDIPRFHRDGRYYVGGNDGPKDRLNNIGLAWSVMTALCGWELDAVRQTRDFQSWAAGGWADRSTANAKDALTGKEEMIVGGSSFSDAIRKSRLPDLWKRMFKYKDEMGAITLIKRCWHLAYLVPQWGFTQKDFKYPSTQSIACLDPVRDSSDEDMDRYSAETGCGKYFAIIAFDGDEIGKWVSGAKTPSFKDQLAQYEGGGAIAYFELDSNPDDDQEKGNLSSRFQSLLNTQRPVSPSYHLQFSEALANFSKLAGPVVNAHFGRLIYSGGDDVLAMLPAEHAIACAHDLSLVFQGKAPLSPIDSISSYRDQDCDCVGFLCDGSRDENKKLIPLVLPGPRATASAGVAIAHFKSPLQDVVRAAQLAEKRAKRKPLDRNSVAVTLMKHSGEILEWGSNWDCGGIELLAAIQDAVGKQELSEKFSHRVCELLSPYLTDEPKHNAPGFNATAVILSELNHALNRQCLLQDVGSRQVLSANIVALTERYLASIQANTPDSNELIQGVIGLCNTAAFSNRIRQS